jgi:hypothetical protein
MSRPASSSCWLVAASIVLSRILSAQAEPPLIPMTTKAMATLVVPGFADFLASDGRAVWVTNVGRIERLDAEHQRPVLTVRYPSRVARWPSRKAQFGWPAVRAARSIVLTGDQVRS